MRPFRADNPPPNEVSASCRVPSIFLDLSLFLCRRLVSDVVDCILCRSGPTGTLPSRTGIPLRKRRAARRAAWIAPSTSPTVGKRRRSLERRRARLGSRARHLHHQSLELSAVTNPRLLQELRVLRLLLPWRRVLRQLLPWLRVQGA